MPLFVTRNGRVIQSRPHEATFFGKHNEAKSKILIFLADRHRRGITTGFTAKQLHLETGVNYDYLLTKLGKWVTWGYVERRAVDRNRPCFVYTIGKRGLRFVNTIIPRERVSDYIKEINEYRASKR